MLREFKSIEEITSLPGYTACVGQGEQAFDSMVGYYRFEKKASRINCGCSQCRTPHRFGYVLHTKSGCVVQVGNVCGPKLFGAAFENARDVHEEEMRRLRRVSEAQDTLASIKAAAIRASALLMKGGPVDKVESAVASLSALCPASVMKNLYLRAETKEATITSTRERTNNDIPPRSRTAPKYVTEEVGRLAGLNVLHSTTPRTFLTEALDLAARYDGMTAAYVADSDVLYRQHLEALPRISSRASKAERQIESASQFFETQNLRQLQLLVTSADERTTMSRLRWDATNWRVTIDRATMAA